MQLERFLIAAVLALGVVAPAPAEEEKKPVDPITKEVDVVRRMLTGIQGKLKHTNARPMAVETVSELTPGMACCSSNIELLDGAMRELRGLIRERGVCFERKRDVEGVEVVNLINQDMRSLDTAVRFFAERAEKPQLQPAYQSCLRAFIGMTRNLKALPECGTAETP